MIMMCMAVLHYLHTTRQGEDWILLMWLKPWLKRAMQCWRYGRILLPGIPDNVLMMLLYYI